MKPGDLVIKRFGFKRVYDIVSDPIKLWRFFTYYEVRKDDKVSLVLGIRLKKIKI